VLGGEHGAARDVVLLNAGAALEVAGAASDLDEGIALASSSIDEGKAGATLERWIAVSNSDLGA
jgi:anthranilate phosphoribosyltransferase